MPLSLTWAEVWARRMARHALLERAPRERLTDVIGMVCGIHAQMMPAAELSIGVRVAGVTRADVRAALWQERRLVKTYGIRGTVHLFPTDELPLWTAALRCRAGIGELRRLAQLGLDEAQLAKVVDAIGQALDGRRLTLAQLGEEVVRRAGAWAGDEVAPAFGSKWPRWRMALGWAALEGCLCFGPNEGNVVTFVRPDQWLGAWSEPDPAKALAEVLRRFLHAYGPATYRDFAQWFAIPVRVAHEAGSMLAEALVEVNVEEYRCLMLAEDTEVVTAPAANTARLLPHFDCYLRGSHPRQQLVGNLAAQTAGGTGTVPILIVGGTVAGVWERRMVGKRVEVRVAPLRPLSAQQRHDLLAEVVRIGEILETEATLTCGTVAVRPHM